MKVLGRKEANRIKRDSFQNVRNRFGTGNSPTGATDWAVAVDQPSAMLENMQRFSKITDRVISVIPEHAIANWITFKSDNVDYIDKFKNQIEKLDFKSELESACKWANLYGGAGIIIGAFDGTVENPGSLTLPLKEVVSNIKYLKVADSKLLSPFMYNTDPFSENFGKVDTYHWSPAEGGGVFEVHHSRVIIIDGLKITDRERQRNKGWGGSLIDQVFDYIKHYDIARGCSADLLQQYITNVVSLGNLQEMAAACNDKESPEYGMLYTRIENLALKVGNLQFMMLDRDAEETFKKETPGGISGYIDVVDKLIELVSFAAGVPRAILFSQQLGTLAGAGQTADNFYEKLEKYQQDKLKPAIDKLIDVIQRMPEFSNVPEDFSYEFNTVRPESDKEKMEVRKLAAETDAINITNGVYSPEKSAERYIGGEFKVEINLDQSDVDGAKGIDDIDETELMTEGETDGESGEQ